MKYYAIKDDNKSIIVNDWEEAKIKLKDFNNPKYKSFLTLEEANAFISGEILDDGVIEPKAYIDGSYDNNTNCYSFGCVLIIDNNIYKFKKAFDDEYAQFKNVAGEIKASSFIINYSINRGIKKLHIFYDYEGIEAWFTRRWAANSLIAKKYLDFAISIENKIEIVFHKVKGHSNNYYNEMVDKLAKEALGIK